MKTAERTAVEASESESKVKVSPYKCFVLLCVRGPNHPFYYQLSRQSTIRWRYKAPKTDGAAPEAREDGGDECRGGVADGRQMDRPDASPASTPASVEELTALRARLARLKMAEPSIRPLEETAKTTDGGRADSFEVPRNLATDSADDSGPPTECYEADYYGGASRSISRSTFATTESGSLTGTVEEEWKEKFESLASVSSKADRKPAEVQPNLSLAAGSASRSIPLNAETLGQLGCSVRASPDPPEEKEEVAAEKKETEGKKAKPSAGVASKTKPATKKKKKKGGLLAGMFSKNRAHSSPNSRTGRSNAPHRGKKRGVPAKSTKAVPKTKTQSGGTTAPKKSDAEKTEKNTAPKKTNADRAAFSHLDGEGRYVKLSDRVRLRPGEGLAKQDTYESHLGEISLRSSHSLLEAVAGRGTEAENEFTATTPRASNGGFKRDIPLAAAEGVSKSAPSADAAKCSDDRGRAAAKLAKSVKSVRTTKSAKSRKAETSKRVELRLSGGGTKISRKKSFLPSPLVPRRRGIDPPEVTEPVEINLGPRKKPSRLRVLKGVAKKRAGRPVGNTERAASKKKAREVDMTELPPAAASFPRIDDGPDAATVDGTFEGSLFTEDITRTTNSDTYSADGTVSYFDGEGDAWETARKFLARGMYRLAFEVTRCQVECHEAGGLCGPGIPPDEDELFGAEGLAAAGELVEVDTGRKARGVEAPFPVTASAYGSYAAPRIDGAEAREECGAERRGGDEDGKREGGIPGGIPGGTSAPSDAGEAERGPPGPSASDVEVAAGDSSGGVPGVADGRPRAAGDGVDGRPPRGPAGDSSRVARPGRGAFSLRSKKSMARNSVIKSARAEQN